MNNNNSKPYQDRREKEYEEKVLLLRRVSKKTTGGNYISFSCLIVVGDGKGKVGIGLGRAVEVPKAIQKAISHAKKGFITIPIVDGTIPHDIRVKYKASELILKPAPKGAGLKVGSVMRAVLSAAGVSNASGKVLRSRNKITNTYAIMKALKQLKARERVVSA